MAGAGWRGGWGGEARWPAAAAEGERGEREREMRERDRERAGRAQLKETAALPSARSAALGKVNFLRRVS